MSPHKEDSIFELTSGALGSSRASGASSFGFIKDDISGDNIFVHHQDSVKPLSERMKVSYRKERSPKGFQATSVEVLD